jgi:acetyltransferase
MAEGVVLARADALRILGERSALSALLVDAVDSGAGMGFLPPLSEDEAGAYWEGVAREVASGARVVILAHAEGALAGSAQLDLCQRPNGVHRAEVQKVMVHRRFRRRGVGRALMRAVDEAARDHGRSTLVLDTFAHQDARRLYEAAGWTHAGDVPAFARTAEGALAATSYYYRMLS